MTLSRQSRALYPEETFWRTLQTFSATRVVIALVLLLFLTLSTKKDFWVIEEFLYQEVCATYVVIAVVFALLAASFNRGFRQQVALQVAVDITVITMLYVAAGGARGGLAILYLFPLAGSAILVNLLPALFFASIVALILLGESGYQFLRLAADPPISQAGLYGAAFLASVFVINRLAARLIKQEQLAQQHGQDLQVQQAINRMVIADMGDGILVVGNDGRVFTVNPAAERMLGLAMPDTEVRTMLTDLPPLAPIAEAFAEWVASQSDQDGAADAAAPVVVAIRPGEGMSLQASTTAWGGRRDLVVHLKVRFAKVTAPGLRKDRAIIFLQDVSEIENQAQQLKLASMGRLTASIAHEVRNPLSAISYASSLLGEEISGASQVRLVRIVDENVGRLNRMIEDILKLSRKVQPHGEPIQIAVVLAEIVGEFRETQSLRDGMIRVTGDDRFRVRFDPMHLREVVVNLLSNAMRYASGTAGCIQLFLVADDGNRLELHVKDDGPAITPEIRAHLFEPFYTTSSKGTGLGLYVARELCLNNGAMLDYEYRLDEQGGGASAKPSGRFVITLAVADAV